MYIVVAIVFWIFGFIAGWIINNIYHSYRRNEDYLDSLEQRRNGLICRKKELDKYKEWAGVLTITHMNEALSLAEKIGALDSEITQLKFYMDMSHLTKTTKVSQEN